MHARDILGLAHHSPAFEARLRAVPGVELVTVASEADAVREAELADVVVLSPAHYTAAVENAVLIASRLQLLQLQSAGFDSLVGRRFPPGTVIATAGDSLAPAVADHALALLLALARRLDVAFGNQQQELWSRSPFDHVELLAGKTAAIVGFGAIGQAVATRLRAFGVRVIGVTRRGTPHPAADASRPIAALDQILPSADLIVLALPLTPETEHLFDRARLGACAPQALLVNVGRGRLVDNDALADALAAGQLRGAGLDVTDPEPLPPGHRLWHMPNTLITPHHGGLGAERQVAEHIAANLGRLSRGEPLAAVVEFARG